MNEIRVKRLEAFIEAEPDEPFNYYALAMEYQDTDAGVTRKYLEKLRADIPEYLPTYYPLAHLYWDMERWEEAEHTFTAGIRLATEQHENKLLNELKGALQNFIFDKP